MTPDRPKKHQKTQSCNASRPHFCFDEGCPTNGKKDFVTSKRLREHQKTKSRYEAAKAAAEGAAAEKAAAIKARRKIYNVRRKKITEISKQPKVNEKTAVAIARNRQLNAARNDLVRKERATFDVPFRLNPDDPSSPCGHHAENVVCDNCPEHRLREGEASCDQLITRYHASSNVAMIMSSSEAVVEENVKNFLVVADERKKELSRTWQNESMSFSLPLPACASCGIRDPDETYAETELLFCVRSRAFPVRNWSWG